MRKFLAILVSLAIILIGCATAPSVAPNIQGAPLQVAGASYESAAKRWPKQAELSVLPELGECINQFEMSDGSTFSFCNIGEFIDQTPRGTFVIWVIDADINDVNLDGEPDIALLTQLTDRGFMVINVIGGPQLLKWLESEASMVSPGKLWKELFVWAKTINIPDGWNPGQNKNPNSPISAGEEAEF